jgi:hypothetical protein
MRRWRISRLCDITTTRRRCSFLRRTDGQMPKRLKQTERSRRKTQTGQEEEEENKPIMLLHYRKCEPNCCHSRSLKFIFFRFRLAFWLDTKSPLGKAMETPSPSDHPKNVCRETRANTQIKQVENIQFWFSFLYYSVNRVGIICVERRETKKKRQLAPLKLTRTLKSLGLCEGLLHTYVRVCVCV